MVGRLLFFELLEAEILWDVQCALVRWSLVPMGFPHVTTEDILYKGSSQTPRLFVDRADLPQQAISFLRVWLV